MSAAANDAKPYSSTREYVRAMTAKYRNNPSLKPCRCGKRASVYYNADFFCVKCHAAALAMRHCTRGRSQSPKRKDVITVSKLEEKWARASGEEIEHAGIGWGSLEVLEKMLATEAQRHRA